jgi:RNA polymerase sigma-70 factor (ECF subfamily)
MNETVMPKDAEQELIIKCQQGDRQAFNRLVMQYQHLVYNFLYRLDSRMHNVEDLAQEVFIKVFRSIRKLKDVRQFKSWLHKIAVRVYLDDLRQRKRLQEHVIADDKVLDIQAHPQATPAQVLEGQELQRALQEAIERLPEEFKLAIVLREIQELSYDEIASALRCSIGTVRSRIFRGRQLLRNMLEGHVTA